jgi:hypothetical protein
MNRDQEAIVALTARVAELEAELAKCRLVGAQLANCAFNLAQRQELTPRDRSELKHVWKLWDAIPRTAKPGEGAERKP